MHRVNKAIIMALKQDRKICKTLTFTRSATAVSIALVIALVSPRAHANVKKKFKRGWETTSKSRQ